MRFETSRSFTGKRTQSSQNRAYGIPRRSQYDTACDVTPQTSVAIACPPINESTSRVSFVVSLFACFGAIV